MQFVWLKLHKYTCLCQGERGGGGGGGGGGGQNTLCRLIYSVWYTFGLTQQLPQEGQDVLFGTEGTFPRLSKLREA